MRSYLWCVGSLVLAAGCLVGRADDGLVLRARLAAESAPIEGPIPIEIALVNTGETVIEVLSLQDNVLGLLYDLEFFGPESWKAERYVGRNFTGNDRYHGLRLERGQATTRLVYLHTFFPKITPGEATVRVVLTRHHGGPGVRGRWETTLKLTIAPPDRQKLLARLDAIINEALGAPDEGAEIAAILKLEAVADPAAIGAYLRLLRDPAVIETRAYIRGGLAEFCRDNGQWTEVVEYLSSCAGQQDEQIFQMMCFKQVRFERREARLLREGTSPWCRLYTLKHLPQCADGTTLPNLKQEAQKLQEQVRQIEETRR